MENFWALDSVRSRAISLTSCGTLFCYSSTLETLFPRLWYLLTIALDVSRRQDCVAFNIFRPSSSQVAQVIGFLSFQAFLASVGSAGQYRAMAIALAQMGATSEQVSYS
jgi:hypothetical protein